MGLNMDSVPSTCTKIITQNSKHYEFNESEFKGSI